MMNSCVHGKAKAFERLNKYEEAMKVTAAPSN
jgi:hypothetical protein